MTRQKSGFFPLIFHLFFAIKFPYNIMMPRLPVVSICYLGSFRLVFNHFHVLGSLYRIEQHCSTKTHAAPALAAPARLYDRSKGFSAKDSNRNRRITCSRWKKRLKVFIEKKEIQMHLTTSAPGLHAGTDPSATVIGMPRCCTCTLLLLSQSV